MAFVDVVSDHLVVHVLAWDASIAIRAKITVPLARILRVTCGPEGTCPAEALVETWGGAAYLPGLFAFGKLWRRWRKSPLAVRAPARCIVVEVDHAGLKRMVVELDEEPPEDAVRRIDDALAGFRAIPALLR